MGVGFTRVRGLPLLFSRSPRIHSNPSARLIAVQPSFSTVRCKTLNIFIKMCYSLPCLPNTILACLLFLLLEDSSRAGNGSALSDSLPPIFSSLPTTNCSLSTLPPSPMESYRFKNGGGRVYPLGPQLLLLSKLKAPVNRAESTLLQVFFLKNLKPFGINTYEKQREGSPLWLTIC